MINSNRNLRTTWIFAKISASSINNLCGKETSLKAKISLINNLGELDMVLAYRKLKVRENLNKRKQSPWSQTKIMWQLRKSDRCCSTAIQTRFGPFISVDDTWIHQDRSVGQQSHGVTFLLLFLHNSAHVRCNYGKIEWIELWTASPTTIFPRFTSSNNFLF